MQEIALDEIAVRFESIQRERAEAADLEYEMELPDESVLVKADQEGLVTILDNLFSNAVQYTPSGGSVVVRVYGDTMDAFLEVEDTGVGIAPRDQERVFERFYRVDKARSRDLGGTGLGLAIVKHLTHAFGGHVGLISQLGRGSLFRIHLPRVQIATRTTIESSAH
jgi:two-component system phosphate regulon sensor histidine kinase PhoR